MSFCEKRSVSINGEVTKTMAGLMVTLIPNVRRSGQVRFPFEYNDDKIVKKVLSAVHIKRIMLTTAFMNGFYGEHNALDVIE